MKEIATSFTFFAVCYVGWLGSLHTFPLNLNVPQVFCAKVGSRYLYTEGFFTPDSFHSTSLATWGSSWASTEAKFIKEFEFLSFSRCFSARIEKSSKTSKIQPNCVIFEWFFEVCSILIEKTAAETQKIEFLDEFCFFRLPT